MTAEEVRQTILEVAIVPVVRAATPEKALAAGRAVAAGGVPIVEVTMTVPGSLEVIAELKKTAADVLIGAGTVLDGAAASKCIAAGAEFIVSPGLHAGVIEAAKEAGKLVLPGALTPTEVVEAWKAGADMVKIFPCGAVGGASYIRALRKPLPHIPMVPTGGVNLETAADFLRAGAAALGIGGELISASALEAGDTAKITGLARQYAAIVREVRGGARKVSGRAKV